MPCRGQTPDDFQNKPARFISIGKDDTVTSTYEVRSSWDVTGTFRYGELVVHDTPNGPLVALQLEKDKHWEKK